MQNTTYLMSRSMRGAMPGFYLAAATLRIHTSRAMGQSAQALGRSTLKEVTSWTSDELASLLRSGPGQDQAVVQ